MKENKISSRIGAQLILAVGISFIISLITLVAISRYAVFYYMSNSGNISVLYFNISNLIMFSTVILVFIITFLLLVNKKIKYIKYASEKVKSIANGNLGETIEIRGNDELAELFNNINSMSRELKDKFENEREIEHTKNELISSVSHDLRTPLTSIIGYIDLLRKKTYKNEEQFTDYIETIYNKSQNLKRLIDELFEYTKLSNPKIELDYNKIDLGGLLQQFTGEYIPIFEKEGLTVIRDIPEQDATVNIDVERIVRVFDNILINAKKYSTKPSNIDVKLKVCNGKAIISISNETNAISVNDLGKIFDKFYRVDKSRAEEGGSGLGLAIAKRIIELHNGRIWAEYVNGIITINIEIPVEPEIRLND